MLNILALCIMRTTVDIDSPILGEVKQLAKQEGKSLGRMVSELLARALGDTGAPKRAVKRQTWKARPMNARIDLSDREAIYEAMDGEETTGNTRRVAKEG